MNRLLALEMGKPALINDQDIEVDLPSAVDERFSDSETTDSQQTTPLLATIQVVRSLGHLTRTLRTPTLSPSTIDTFERLFDTCLTTFPPSYHPKSDHSLDPRYLSPIIHLQNARFLLHRHNLSPLSPTDARSSALDYCLSIALDTAHLLSRCLQPVPVQGASEDRPAVFASSASALLCTHIWRCTLLLLFRQEYAAALACVHASALIGDLRTINAACGRYLAFFIRCLLDRRRSGPVDLGRDEELVAYVAGDLHGSFDWVSSDMAQDVQSPPPQPPPVPSPSSGHPESSQDVIDWEGWKWVETTVQHLLAEQQQQQQQQRPEITTHQLARPNESTFLSPTATGDSEADARRSSSHSRMTIASII